MLEILKLILRKISKNVYDKKITCGGMNDLEPKILISNSYRDASQNGTRRQTDESWCPERFCIPFNESGFSVNSYEVDSNAFFLSGKALYTITILLCPFLTLICVCGLCPTSPRCPQLSGTVFLNLGAFCSEH
jgi:hypothetical protein